MESLPPSGPPPPPPASSAPPIDGRAAGDPARTAAAPPSGWAVDAGHGATWWSDGWRLFKAFPWVWIGSTVVFVALMLGLALIPVLGHIASTLLYPVLGAGLLVGARAIDQGERLTFGHLFACFDSRLGPLVLAGFLYIAAWFVIWLIAIAICVAIFGFESLTALMATDPTLADFSGLATFGMAALVALLIVLVLGTPLLMAYWFAPALIALRGDRPVAAMKASFAASLRNVPPLLIYSLLGMVFGLLATLPAALGWIVLAPVFMASVYASYKDIFGAPA